MHAFLTLALVVTHACAALMMATAYIQNNYKTNYGCITAPRGTKAPYPSQQDPRIDSC